MSLIEMPINVFNIKSIKLKKNKTNISDECHTIIPSSYNIHSTEIYKVQ